MKIKADFIKQKRKNRFMNLVILSVILMILTVIEIFSKEIFDASVKFTIYIQSKNTPNFLKFMQLISFAGTARIYIPITILIFNFANVYKAFIISMIYSLTHFLTGVLKMMIQDPRPYWISGDIKNDNCEMGYGNPSGHAMSSVAFYLTLWHLLSENCKMEKKFNRKTCSLLFFVIIIFTILMTRIFLGAHSIDQIILGGSIGFLIYFFFFQILLIDTIDKFEFKDFIMIKIKYFGIIYFLLSLLTILYYLWKDFTHDKNWEFIIQNDKDCSKIPENRKYEKESLLSLPIFISSFFSILGIKLEINYLFQGNIEKWLDCNFNQTFDDDESLLTTISMSRDTLWNQTNSIKSVLRLFVIVLMNIVSIVLYYFVDFSYPLYIVLIFKLLVPNSLVCFINFFMVKHVCSKVGLINNYSLSLFNEQLV